MEKKELSLPFVDLHAAGIDIGSRNHLVAVDQNPEHVQEYGVYTKDHEKLIVHFQQFGITIVAMESTGSYWPTLFNALQGAGFEGLLVNRSQTKNVKGKKTDVLDCIWIQKNAQSWIVKWKFPIERLLTKITNLLFASATPA